MLCMQGKMSSLFLLEVCGAFNVHVVVVVVDDGGAFVSVH